MKQTTDSQLADQAYRDYQRATEATDNKAAVAFEFNVIATHHGVPLKLSATSPERFAKICRLVIQRYSKYAGSRIHNEWKLGGAE